MLVFELFFCGIVSSYGMSGFEFFNFSCKLYSEQLNNEWEWIIKRL